MQLQEEEEEDKTEEKEEVVDTENTDTASSSPDQRVRSGTQTCNLACVSLVLFKANIQPLT